MSKQQYKKAMKHHKAYFMYFGASSKEARKEAWKAVRHENKAFKKLEQINLRNFAIT